MGRDDGQPRFWAEMHEIIKSLTEIKEELATLRADMVWVKGIVEDVCTDVEDLKAFKWRVYGISLGVSLTVNFGLYFLRG